MIAYAIIMFVIAALFLYLGIAVYQGNTNLIHDYHQTNVREADRRDYGKAFAMGLFAICATLLLSGAMALLHQMSVSLAALLLGLIVSVVILAKAQKKYNGGIF